MTLFDALMLTGRLPASQVRELCLAATDLSLAELDYDEAFDTADLGHRIWLGARQKRADSGDDGYPQGNRQTASDVELSYDVALAGAVFLDTLRELAEARVASARAHLDLLRIRFGVDQIGATNKPNMDQGETQ